MSFTSSATDRPGLAAPDRSRHVAVDSLLLTASMLTRQIRQLQFAAEDATAWLQAVRALGAAVQQALTRHILAAEPDGAAPRWPGPTGMTPARELLREHDDLMAAAAALAFETSAPRVEDIWRVVEVTEKAILLESLIAAHCRSLNCFVQSTRPVVPVAAEYSR